MDNIRATLSCATRTASREPHIYASTQQQAFRAFGYAQMHAHADLLLRMYAAGRGRAAEVYGAPFVELDRQAPLVPVVALRDVCVARPTASNTGSARSTMLSDAVRLTRK